MKQREANKAALESARAWLYDSDLDVIFGIDVYDETDENILDNARLKAFHRIGTLLTKGKP